MSQTLSLDESITSAAVAADAISRRARRLGVGHDPEHLEEITTSVQRVNLPSLASA